MRFLLNRYALKVASGAVCVLGLIATLVACAANAGPTENVASISSPLVIAGLFATGVDAGGTPLAAGDTDPHYVLSSGDPMRPGPKALAVAAMTGWTANTPSSSWISAQANAIGANLGVYTYTTTFSLAGVDPTTVVITGSWACDDTCELLLNGVTVATYAAPAWATPVVFTIPASSPFAPGANTLAFVVTNSGGGTTGLQVLSISGTSSGCTADTQCAMAQFCNTQTGTCVGTLPSGTPIPTITGHTPVLNGICASGVGPAVCDAGVCDMTNNECGFANGDGPCNPANGFQLCQSGACSQNGTCEPSGGCNVDGDCPAGDTCDTDAGTCTANPDAGADGSADGSEDASADGSEGAGGDSSVGADGSEGFDGSEDANSDGSGLTGADGSGGSDASRDGSRGADGSAGLDASLDASAAADASEEDSAAAAADGQATGEGGPNADRELEGGGLSCSASAAMSNNSSSAPLSVLALVLVAALGRGRRRRSQGDLGE